jgi:hypothetical protein
MAAPVYAALPFDSGWRFLKGDPAAAEQPQLDDGSWRTVNVPHDWAIESPFDEKNPARGAGAFLPGGVGWHRKNFTLTASDAKRRVFVDFDGVMANSDFDASPCKWRVASEPGTIEAACKNGPGEELRTAGKAGQSKLTPDWDHVSYVTATATVTDEVAFQISGPGAVAAADNADNASQQRTYQAVCIAVVRATASKGRIIVNASSAGLASSSVTIKAVSK